MVYQLRSHHGPGASCIVIGERVMATKEKGRQWDGRSRPSDDKYREEFNRIFGVKKDKKTNKNNASGLIGTNKDSPSDG